MNIVMLVGVVDRDPRIGNGDKPNASMSVTVTETWNDRASGEMKERRQFIRVATFTKDGVENMRRIRPGSVVAVRGALSSRKDGETWVMEVVVGFGGEIKIVGSAAGAVRRDEDRRRDDRDGDNGRAASGGRGRVDDLNDDIPFRMCVD